MNRAAPAPATLMLSSLAALTLLAASRAEPVITQTTDTLDIRRYFPSGVGDTWQYTNLVKDGLSPISILVPRTLTHGGRTVVQRDENNGDHRYQTVDAEGLHVYQLYFRGDVVVTYDRRVQLVPPQLARGAPHASEARYRTLSTGAETERGRQTYRFTFERRETAETTLGTFTDCVVTRTEALRTDEAGTGKGYDLREWLAAGVGPVKVQGEIFWTDASGRRTRTFKVDARLEQATVGGKAVVAR